MLGAKNPPSDLQNLRMKWLSLSVAALPAQNVSDSVHDPQGIRIFSTSSSFGKRERFARKFFRFRVSSFILERDGESGHRPNRLGALRSEYSPVHFQIVRFQLFGLGITSFTSQSHRQIVDRRKCVRIFRTGGMTPNVGRTLKEAVRAGIESEVSVNISHRVHHLRLKFGILR